MIERISVRVASLALLVLGALGWSGLGLFFFGVLGAIGGAAIGGGLAYLISQPALEN